MGIHDPYSAGGNITGVAELTDYNDGTCSTHDRRKECIQSCILKI